MRATPRPEEIYFEKCPGWALSDGPWLQNLTVKLAEHRKRTTNFSNTKMQEHSEYVDSLEREPAATKEQGDALTKVGFFLRRLGLHRLAWIAGIIVFPLSHFWLGAQTEPFYSESYNLLFYSYVCIADFGVFCLRGSSLLRDRSKEFFYLFIWSLPIWMSFDLLNKRLYSWYYVMSPPRPVGTLVPLIRLILITGTVLAAELETLDLIVAAINKWKASGKISGPRFSLNGWGVCALFSSGVVMLALMLTFPKYCFGLAWIYLYFLTDPLCYWAHRREKDHVGKSLLGQMASGDYTRFVGLLIAGTVVGFLWESWNAVSRYKYIYTLPFLDEPKFGEMPVFGLMAYPLWPLGLYGAVNLISLLRRGRNWELSVQENKKSRGMPLITFAILALLFQLPFVIQNVFEGSVFFSNHSWNLFGTSWARPVTWYFGEELGANGIQALRKRNAEQGHQFLRLKERPLEIDPALYERMRRVVRMSELKGMGLHYAMELERLKIGSVEDLARQDPEELTRQFRKVDASARLEVIKIWVLAARRDPPCF